VVPRTFLGAFILSSIIRIISIIIPKQIYNLPSHPMTVQFLIRLQLLLFAWMAHVRLSKALEGYFNDRHIHSSSSSSLKEQYTKISTLTTSKLIANYYLLITASQFHLPYYASRLLPNTFATILVTLSYAAWFINKPHITAAYLIFTTAIFRCDILLLLFTIGLTMLIRRELSIKHALIIGIITGMFSLILTVPLDSLLWRRLIWPEFEVWWFNTVDNRSSEYGVNAFHWYFSRALPKGMLLTALLVPLAFIRPPESSTKTSTITQKESRSIQKTSRMFDLHLLHFFVPVCGFILIYSFLPHKEIRFIFAAIPMFNVCAAYGMSKLHHMAFSASNQPKSKSRNYKLLILRCIYLCGLGSIACTLMGSMIFMNISKENYPSGVALERLRHHLEQETSEKWNTIHVHVDVASAMTGVSLFGQRHISYRYLNREEDVYEGPFRIGKSGYEEENSNTGSTEMTLFTHLVTEQGLVEGYHVIDTVQGHPRLDIRNFRIETQDAIYIQERNGY